MQKIIFRAELHTAKKRQRLKIFGLKDTFDIPGLSELYRLGTGLECSYHQGMHNWADIFLLEIVDPCSLEPVSEGEMGEMVVITLCKEVTLLIRYRTRDLARLNPGNWDCQLSLPCHDCILGRSDDMFIFRGVNIYPFNLLRFWRNSKK